MSDTAVIDAPPEVQLPAACEPAPPPPAWTWAHGEAITFTAGPMGSRAWTEATLRCRLEFPFSDLAAVDAEAERDLAAAAEARASAIGELGQWRDLWAKHQQAAREVEAAARAMKRLDLDKADAIDQLSGEKLVAQLASLKAQRGPLEERYSAARIGLAELQLHCESFREEVEDAAARAASEAHVELANRIAAETAAAQAELLAALQPHLARLAALHQQAEAVRGKRYVVARVGAELVARLAGGKCHEAAADDPDDDTALPDAVE